MRILRFWVSFSYALVHLPAFIAGTILFGLAGTIWSLVVAGVLYSYLNAWMLERTLGIRLGEILVQLRRPLGAAFLMIGAVLAVGTVVGSGSWLSLAVKTVTGVVVFCSAQYSLWRLEGRPTGIERRLLQVLSRS